MYLSRLYLNPRNRDARRDLACAYELHRTVWRAFSHDVERRVLFRSEFEGNTPLVLVQSTEAPDWERLPGTYLTRPAEWKAYTPHFVAGQRLRFRLRANPTKCTSASGDSARRRLGLLNERDQIDWLVRKGSDAGFELDLRSILALPEGWTVNPKGGRFWAVRFEGVLTVREPVRLVETANRGIGSGKGLGFGLLSLAPARARSHPNVYSHISRD